MAIQIVIDASIFNKLYLKEPDRHSAIGFFEFAERKGASLIAPSIFLYEVLAVAAPSEFGAERAHDLIKQFKRSGFKIVEVNDQIVRKAIEICNSGHPKSGFPSFYDSAYHALAIERGAVFLTSDQRHAAKASGFGGVVFLKDWRTHFTAL